MRLAHSWESTLYFHITIRLPTKYCCHLWTGAPLNCFSLLDHIQRSISNAIYLNLTTMLDSLTHRRNISLLQIQDCYDKKLMMSLHMKATMMKVSDPIIFGHCIKVCIFLFKLETRLKTGLIPSCGLSLK